MFQNKGHGFRIRHEIPPLSLVAKKACIAVSGLNVVPGQVSESPGDLPEIPPNRF